MFMLCKNVKKTNKESYLSNNWMLLNSFFGSRNKLLFFMVSLV